MLDEPDVNSIYRRVDGFTVGHADNNIIRSFIDLEANRAYFDSDEFIHWLEMTARLPLYYDWLERDIASSNFSLIDEIVDIHNGEQLLYGFYMRDPGYFRLHKAMLGDIVAVGLPTRTGGQHDVLFPDGRFGINRNSQHKDAAWDFVRRFFLPDGPVSRFADIPIRIDRYEERIAELMTPNIVDGVEVPVVIDEFQWELNAALTFMDIDIFAMTEEEAAAVRDIIDNVSLTYQESDGIISSIFNEETSAFFNGTRTAEETARILQNRVQRVLDERG